MKLPIYALLGITSLTFACGPDEGEKEGEKIQTSQVHSIVAQNTENALTTTLDNANFLETSDLIEKIVGATGESCEPIAVPDGEDAPVEPNCEPRSLDLDIDDYRLDRADFAEYLKQTVFSDENVETSTETEIVYLISGESVCGEADPMFPSSCAQDFDKAQLRLRVTSPAANAVDIDLLVGPDRDNPFSAEFHNNLLAVEADLDGIEGSLGYLQSQSLIEDDLDIPTTFDGRLRAQIEVEGPKVISASVSVLRAINVAGGDFGLKVGANEPTLKVTLDGELEVISLLADVGELNLRSQGGDILGNSNDTFELNLAGIDAQAALYAQTDSIIFAGVGLGDGQSTVKVNGKQALSLDFNADSGRHIDFVASPSANGVKLDFADSVKVALGLSIDDADAPAWVKDDVLNISLDGAAAPSLVIDGEYLEVAAGTFKASLENAGSSFEANAGQCMTANGGVDEGDDGGSVVETNLIEDMAVVACQ